jgi:hypothetical protein
MNAPSHGNNYVLNRLLSATANKMKMSSFPSTVESAEALRIEDFPALASLQLGDEDLSMLARQGFLNREVRRGHEVFKLRFRRDAKQCIKYVSVSQVAAVRVELDKLQSITRLKRKLAAVTREAKRVLRQTKPSLQPILESHGLAFHGLAIRRRHGQKPNASLRNIHPTR